jgi:antibiotic biosynthesis monooxygenase (ABM) superfamily enzyme
MTKNGSSLHHHKQIEPVSLVFSFTVNKGKEKQFEKWAHEITTAVEHFEGHLGSSWIRTSNNAMDYIVIIKFFDLVDSNRWLESSIRHSLIQKVLPLVKETKPDSVQNVTGLETWFTLPGRVTLKPPARWKMVIVTMIGIYPIGLLYQAYLVPYFKLLPLLLRPVALSLLLTPLLTYVVMPRLTKWFRHWLYPDK